MRSSKVFSLHYSEKYRTFIYDVSQIRKATMGISKTVIEMQLEFVGRKVVSLRVQQFEI